ncbi:myeloid-associated differentiation marker-like protein 2 [Lampetra fluviatilis]
MDGGDNEDVGGGGGYLDWGSVLSPRGLLRLLQAALTCAALSLAVHRGGWAFSYGLLCLLVWAVCLALSAAVLVLELSRVSACIPASWHNLRVSLAALAALLCATASALYPLFSLRDYQCFFRGCEAVRAFRVAVTCCSAGACLAYGIDAGLAVARPGKAAEGRAAMASVSGLLRVAEIFCGAVILGCVFSGGQYGRYLATHWCLAVYCLCLALTLLVTVLSIRGGAAADATSGTTTAATTATATAAAACCVPLERGVALATLLSVLLYVSAAVIWPVYAFDPQYGSPARPSRCAHERCAWDVHVLVSAFTALNLVAYVADLACSQRALRRASAGHEQRPQQHQQQQQQQKQQQKHQQQQKLQQQKLQQPQLKQPHKSVPPPYPGGASNRC